MTAASIRALLVPALEKEFPGRGLRVSSPPDPLVATFPAACAEVGDVLIYDDAVEATVCIEHVTHHHVTASDAGIGEDERAREITEGVVEFLHDLFADRVLLWSFQRGQGGGGWSRPHDGSLPADVSADADVFVWSRRIANLDGR